MDRERIGNVPYEATKEGSRLKIRFFPKSETAKNPDGIVFALDLDANDRKKLANLLK